ncbi:MAG: cobyrinic acid a,c-diamide synthase [Caloramator sp.]|nr:MAG: cobyrinic acid a,c-diamide synthase [Caloramator sp.]
MKSMKSIMISALSSGSGKTLFTAGLIKLLSKMGLDVLPAKSGPDYIDTQYLSQAAGCMAQNIDFHLQGKLGAKECLFIEDRNYLVIEGAMGYFDGIYNTFENSSFDISNTLDIDTLLIYSPKGEMFSMIPKIKGAVDFSCGRIKGIVLNRTNRRIYELIKPKIEEYVGIRVLGFIEEDEDFSIKSRHLGLVQSQEVYNSSLIIDKMSDKIKENIDMEYLMALFKDLNYYRRLELNKRDVDVCILKDVAFSFYYRENIMLLEKTCNVCYVSPLRDYSIPKCDFLYIGGGYPEIFKHELSFNTSMKASIKRYAEDGGYIYAECGGLMYLTKEIDGEEMVGVFDGRAKMTNKLQNFGYVDLKLQDEFLIGDCNDTFTGHEFHRSVVEIDDKRYVEVEKTMGDANWRCGYRYKNVCAMYPHISFMGNIEAFNKMLDKIEGRIGV